MLNKRLDKGGQIGTTLTWMIATIIILLTIVIFLVVSGAFGTIKGISLGSKKFTLTDYYGQQQTLFAIIDTLGIRLAIISDDYATVENKIKPILKEIGETKTKGYNVGWTFIYENGKKRTIKGYSGNRRFSFEVFGFAFEDFGKKFKIKLREEHYS